MIRPQKKERIRSGILREPPRQFPAHRAFIRRHKCVCCQGSHQIECAHLRLDAGGGMGIKTHDAFCVSLCARCHFSQHTMGEKAFWASVPADPWKLALTFALASPVAEVRDYARDVMAPLLDRFAEYDARIKALCEMEAG